MSEKGLSGLWYDRKKKWELVELPVYQPDDDEIVVRVTATGICGSDLHVTRGDGRDENSPERGPLAMGHEMTGVVHSLGKKVKTDSLKKPLKMKESNFYYKLAKPSHIFLIKPYL